MTRKPKPTAKTERNVVSYEERVERATEVLWCQVRGIDRDIRRQVVARVARRAGEAEATRG